MSSRNPESLVASFTQSRPNRVLNIERNEDGTAVLRQNEFELVNGQFSKPSRLGVVKITKKDWDHLKKVMDEFFEQEEQS